MCMYIWNYFFIIRVCVCVVGACVGFMLLMYDFVCLHLTVIRLFSSVDGTLCLSASLTQLCFVCLLSNPIITVLIPQLYPC